MFCGTLGLDDRSSQFYKETGDNEVGQEVGSVSVFMRGRGSMAEVMKGFCDIRSLKATVTRECSSWFPKCRLTPKGYTVANCTALKF